MIHAHLDAFREQNTEHQFALQNPKLLKVQPGYGEIMARSGSMVAYQGQAAFEHAGSGGMSKMLKKMATGEGVPLMKVNGNGEVFLADSAAEIQILYLENDSVTTNGSNILAFSASIAWDIKKVSGGGAGMLAGGLFNVVLQGTGFVAVTTDGPPVILDVTEAPTFADPQAAVMWTGGVTTSINTDIKLGKALTGRSSGESIQLAFGGQGWVMVQPSEGRYIPTAG